MKTNRPTSTEMVFILDRSGSMGGLEADTIGGFNGMIESQKAEPGAAVVTTVLFDDRTDVIANRVPLNQVAPLTSREYFVRGCTALLPSVPVRARGFERVRSAVSREEDAVSTMHRKPARGGGPTKPSSSSPPTAWRTPASTTPSQR